jgi:amidohydrolase
MSRTLALAVALLGLIQPAWASQFSARIDDAVERHSAQVVSWRRDFHQHPELGNREVRTAGIVAKELKRLGFVVRTGIASTGVSGYLRGRSAHPLLALRADMDALPVKEPEGLAFASKAKGEYRGVEVDVMHACGHDAHTAMLLGAARALAEMKTDLPGSVLLVFQPAEEGPPPGETGGAARMLEEGVFVPYRPDAIVGLHVFSTLRSHQLGMRAGPIMAEADLFEITLKGAQTHGSKPWSGRDPLLAGARLVDALQSIVARRVNVVESPAVVTVGAFNAGVRYNIIPETATIIGNVRTFDDETRELVFSEIRKIAEHTALAHSVEASVEIQRRTLVTRNDRGLSERLRSSLEKSAGAENVVDMPLLTIAEDFSYFDREVPGFYFFLGSTAPTQDPRTAPANHSPMFQVDEAALPLGLKALLNITFDFLSAPKP